MRSDRDELNEAREREYGYREVSAKHVRLADWAATREDEAFKVLVNRLRVRKWSREVRAEGSERTQKLRARMAASARRRRAADPAAARANDRAKRAAAYKRNPVVLTCRDCGAVWCKVPWVKGVRPEFCSNKCREHWRYHHDPAYRDRQKANVARAWRAKHPAAERGPRAGEAHPRAKLTAENVRAIRARHAGGESIAALARAFGVAERTVTFAVRRETWRHVP